MIGNYKKLQIFQINNPSMQISNEAEIWYRRVGYLDILLRNLCWASIFLLGAGLWIYPISDTILIPSFLYLFFFTLYHLFFRYCYDLKIEFMKSSLYLSPRWGLERGRGDVGLGPLSSRFTIPKVDAKDINTILIYDSKYRLFSALLFFIFPFSPFFSLAILGKSLGVVSFSLLLFSGVISIILIKHYSKYFIVPEYYLLNTKFNCWNFLLGKEGNPFERQYRCTLALTIVLWVMFSPALIALF